VLCGCSIWDFETQLGGAVECVARVNSVDRDSPAAGALNTCQQSASLPSMQVNPRTWSRSMAAVLLEVKWIGRVVIITIAPWAQFLGN